MKPTNTNQVSITSLPTADEAISTIGAMHHQESTSYKQQDYFPKNKNINSNNTIMKSGGGVRRVDESCRERMSQWCFDVVDFCKLNRETVAIAMSILDRYVMTTSATPALRNRNRFQLASMTALYTAVKINEEEVMDPNLLASISRGAITADDIVMMEREMLKALEWRVQPPTAAAFVRSFMSILREDKEAKKYLDEQTLQRIMDYSIFQTELAVKDNRLITVSPSTIAFAAIANAVNELGVRPLVHLAQVAVEICAINVDVCVFVRRQLMASTLSINVTICSFGSPSLQEDDIMTSHEKSLSSRGSGQESPSSVSFRVDAMQQ